MLGLSSLKWFAIAGIITAVLGALWHISNLQANLAVAKKDNELLTNTVNEQSSLINNQLDDISSIQDSMIKLNKEKLILNRKLIDLNERFEVSANGTSRDFGKITRAKPGLVNNIINRATKSVNRCFEITTGAEIKEGETNNECQDIIDNLK